MTLLDRSSFSLELDGLERHYGGTVALAALEAQVPAGVGRIALVGPSGGGKSTLLRLCGALEVPTAGRLRLDGKDLPGDEAGQRIWRRHCGFVFQSWSLFLHWTALENVRRPLVEVHGVTPAEAQARAQSLLRELGLGDRGHHRPAELSGGQQQRVALARAVAHRPDWLLLDEPTSALDPERTRGLVAQIRLLCEGGQRLIFASHDVAFTEALAQWVIFLREGRIELSGPAAEVFASEVWRRFRG